MADAAKMTTQLSCVETLRATVLLEEALRQLAFLGRLAPDPRSVNSNELCASMGDEIIRIIGEQQELQQKHDMLAGEILELRGIQNKDRYTVVENELKSVSNRLRESNRRLCKNLKQKPNVQDNIVKLNRERHRIEEWLSETLEELKAGGTFRCLLDNVAKEKSSQERLTEVRRRNRETNQAVRLLEAELKKETAEYERLRQQSTQEITALKEELQRVRFKSSTHLAFKEKQFAAQEAGQQYIYIQRERTLEKELVDLQQEKELDSFIFRKNAEFSEKYIQKLQAEREAQHRLHQRLTEEKQRELTALLKKQNSITRALSISRSKLEEEENQRGEKLAAEQREAWAREERHQQESRQQEAAMVLQHFARTYLKKVQEAERNAKAKSKKSRGKK